MTLYNPDVSAKLLAQKPANAVWRYPSRRDLGRCCSGAWGRVAAGRWEIEQETLVKVGELKQHM